MDATIIDAPKSIKNLEQTRDPEIRQAQKGNQWYLGAKFHIGVDAGTGMVHTVRTTTTNVNDAMVAHELLRPDGEVAYGASAYCAVAKA